MKLPQTIDRRGLAPLAPHDTHAIRVIVRRVANQAPYRVRGKHHHYLFEWDYELQAHILDVPQSAWMAGHPLSGPYRDNLSIAHDIQASRSASAAPLVFLLVPWVNAVAPAASPPAAASTDAPDFVGPICQMLTKLRAPDIVLHALSLAQGSDNTALLAFISTIPDEPATTLPEETAVTGEPEAAVFFEINPKTDEPYTPAALRMRAMRARQKADKESTQDSA